MTQSTFAAKDFEGPQIRRLCDVVMKGGITSGVVYPLTICQLATAYAIKNIGGTSVGAIAAAITAAAEYRRRRFGSGQGYAELTKLPEFLGRRGALRALFTADKIARPLLNRALNLIGPAPFVQRLFVFFAMLLGQYVWIPLLTIAAVFAIFWWVVGPLQGMPLRHAIVASVVIGLLIAIAASGARYVCHVASVLKRNSFGWCHAYSDDGEAKVTGVADVTLLNARDVPPLFNWLEAFIAQTAGVPASQPLTFGDLWNAPHPSWHDAAPRERCIDFRMVTTCLTVGRPFELPFEPDSAISQIPDPETDVDDDGDRRPSIYFCADELEKYFSQHVVAHMTRHGKQTTLGDNATAYYRFPAAAKLPIVVATRLSMSFPVLFCALPLYALDARGTMQRLWFSDGGLTSNFPVHFFDSPLPRWPTFAIDLLGGDPAQSRQSDLGAHAYAPGAVFMESELPPGRVNPWNALDRGPKSGNVLGFASAMLDAARNWQDVTLGTLPGNSSRIVGIRLSPQQGGLNLNMPPEVIGQMTQLGMAAGAKLLQVFASDAPDPSGWRSHRWLRYRAIMGAITRWLDGYQRGYRPFDEDPAQQPYAQMIEELPHQQPGVSASTEHLTSLPICDTFYELEEQPIAVLPTRPAV
jgi:predicted acylesterase/phospholipase RssA